MSKHFSLLIFADENDIAGGFQTYKQLVKRTLLSKIERGRNTGKQRWKWIAVYHFVKN